MTCSKCARLIQRGQSSTTWWEEKNGKHYYRVAHVECPTRADKVLDGRWCADHCPEGRHDAGCPVGGMCA